MNNKINQFILLTKSYFSLYLSIALSIFLFILFFQPFAVNTFGFENRLLFLAGFGIIALVLLVLAQIIFQAPLLKKEDEISDNPVSIPLYFFFQVAATSLAFIFYTRFVGQVSITFNVVVRAVFICLSLPVTLIIKFRLDAYQARLKNLLLENRKLKQFSEDYARKYVEIASDTDSDYLRVQVSEIVYVKSADNYVEIGYHDEGAVKKKMARNTLRKVEQQLAEFNHFIRTHRTSLVNIQYIDKLHKNLNTYWLSLDKTKETIPVSRQYLMAVKDVL